MLNTTPTATNGAKTLFVASLKPGERIIAFFMVARAALEPFRDPAKGKYLALTLSDKTGQVAAKVWDNGPALAETVKPGVVVKVAADAREYNGRLELTVNKIRPANPDECDLADFLPSTDGDIEMMLKMVDTAIMQITNRDLYALARSFYGLPAFKQAFSSAPATRRVHHAYLGGLLEQTVENFILA